MPAKSEVDHIYLLLSIMEHTEGKINWNDVAKDTGLYKDGKFVRQAFNSIKTKYGSSTSAAITSSSDTPKKTATKSTPKKRGKMNGDDTPSKKPKTAVADQASENGVDSDLKAGE